MECETDYVAMSFVRDAAHIAQLREHIDNLGGRAQIVAKIEDQQAIRHIDDIILAADVIMVARGDLGIEVSIEELPIIQRRIIRHCHRLGRPLHRRHAHAGIHDHAAHPHPCGSHGRFQRHL